MKHISSPVSHIKAYTWEYRSLTRLGFPVLVTQIGIILVSFADTMMVGAYGDRVSGLAAAAFANSLFMIPIVMLLGFAAGMTPLVGALYGRKDSFNLGRTVRIGLQVNTMTALALTAVMGSIYFFLHRFGQPEELLPLIRPYYLLLLASLLPTAIFNCAQQSANGTTDTATPMWVILGCNCLNIIGNYILIFGNFGAPEMGLTGAGLSTLIARWTGAVVMLIILRFSKRYSAYRMGLLTSGAQVGADTAASGGLQTSTMMRRRVWNTSYPMMIQSGVECTLWSLGAIVSGWYGKVQLASYQVVNTIAQLGFMIYMSFGVATSIRVANYTGVGDALGVRRITAAGLHISLLLATLASVGFYFFGHNMATLFTNDTNVLEAAGLLIAPLILYQYGDAMQLTFVNALRGTGNVKPLLWISILAYVVVGISTLYLFGVTLDGRNVGVYYSFSAALFTASIGLYLAFRRTLRSLSATPEA